MTDILLLIAVGYVNCVSPLTTQQLIAVVILLFIFRCTIPLACGMICNEKHSRLLHRKETGSLEVGFENVASGSVFFLQGLNEIQSECNESLDFETCPDLNGPYSCSSIGNTTGQTEPADCHNNTLHDYNALNEKQYDQQEKLFDTGFVCCSRLEESIPSERYYRKCYDQNFSSNLIDVNTECVFKFDFAVIMHFCQLIFRFLKFGLLGLCFMLLFVNVNEDCCEINEYVQIKSTHYTIVHVVLFGCNMLSFKWSCSTADFVT